MPYFIDYGVMMDGLKKIVTEKGIKIYRLAKDLNVPRSTVRSWLAGSVPREKHLILLVNYFHAKPEYLVFGDKSYAPTLKDEIMWIAKKMQTYKPETIEKIAKIIDALDDTKKKQKIA